MKLYEVNIAIQQLLDQLDPDPETGEVRADTESIVEQLGQLQMERQSILEYIAKMVIDIRSDVAALKAEEKRLKERRDKLENKEQRLMAVLDRECCGVKTDCGVATVNYRKVTRVNVGNPAVALRYFQENGFDRCFKTPEPELNKTEVKKVLTAGIIVPGVTLEHDVSCSLR